MEKKDIINLGDDDSNNDYYCFDFNIGFNYNECKLISGNTINNSNGFNDTKSDSNSENDRMYVFNFQKIRITFSTSDTGKRGSKRRIEMAIVESVFTEHKVKEWKSTYIGIGFFRYDLNRDNINISIKTFFNNIMKI